MGEGGVNWNNLGMTLSSLVCSRCRTACDQRSLVKKSCRIPMGLSLTFALGLSCEEFRHVPQNKIPQKFL